MSKSPDPPVEMIRDMRVELLHDLRVLGIDPSPSNIRMCAGPPFCDGSAPFSCFACFVVRCTDPRSSEEIVRDYKYWKNQ